MVRSDRVNRLGEEVAGKSMPTSIHRHKYNMHTDLTNEKGFVTLNHEEIQTSIQKKSF
jgi:hypothetical protein